MKNYIKRWIACTVSLLWGCCVMAQSNITRVEYYIDADPGFGNATAISITPGTLLNNIGIPINPTALSTGMHIVGLRALAGGKWSLDNTWLFIKPAATTAQANISRVEYYIDADPGYGKATAVPVTAGATVNAVAIPINPTVLSNGVHLVGLRALDANGKWGLDNTWLFINQPSTQPQANIARVEYYVDADPGYGKATAVSVTAGATVNAVAIPINPTVLSNGVHLVGLRALDANGKWGLDNTWLFINQPATQPQANIARVEYYIDADPGYGKATALSIPVDSIVTSVAIPINPTTLSTGVHLVGLRALDANGKWSLDNTWLFISQPATLPQANLTRVEYYIDADPGYGKATAISIPADSVVSSVAIPINPTALNTGVHVVGLRALDANGKWGLDNTWLFIKPAAVAAQPNLGRVEYYIDTDPGYGKGVPIAFNPATQLPNFNLPVNVTGLATGAHILFIRSLDANGKWGLDDTIPFTTPTALAAPSIVVNSINYTTFCVNGNVKVAYQATGTYNTGNVFTAVLSDSSGSFANPVVIGSVTGTNTSSLISCTLPGNLPAGSKYKVRVTSSNPVVSNLAGIAGLILRPVPVPVAITGDSAVNVNNSYTDSVASVTGLTYAWSSTGAVITPNNNKATVLWDSTGQPEKLQLVQTNQYTCTDTIVKLVNVYPLRIDSVKVSVGTLCPGNNIVVTAKVSGAYKAGNIFTVQLSDTTGGFTNPVAIGSLAASPQGVMVPENIDATLPFPLLNGTRYVIRVVGSMPADTGKAVAFAVNPTPAVTNATKFAVCSGAATNIALTASTPGTNTFTWLITKATGGVSGASGGAGNSIAQTLANPGNAIADSLVYSITATSAAGCVSAVTADTVIINAIPVVTNLKNSAICSGTGINIALTASTVPGANTFTWAISKATGGVTGASAGAGQSVVQTLTNPGNTVADSVVYSITASSAAGCTSASAADTVIVNAIPVIGAGATHSAICSGSTTNIVLTATTAGANTFNWVTGEATGGVSGASAGVGQSIAQTLVNPGNTVADSVVYNITATSAAGCTAALADTVIVNAKPVITATLTNYPICSGATTNIALTATTTPGANTFTWAVTKATGNVTGASAGTGAAIAQTLTNPGNTVADSVIYTVTAASAGGCTSAAVADTVIINAVPAVTSATRFAVCSGGSTAIALKASTTQGANVFKWVVSKASGGVTGASGASGSSIVQTLTNPGNTVADSVVYSVTATSAAGCASKAAADTVIVNAKPAVVANTTSTAICSGTTTNIVLTATSTPGINTFAWALTKATGGVTGASGGSGTVIAQTLVNPGTSITDSVVYSITATSAAGCVSAITPDTVLITSLQVPVITQTGPTTFCAGDSLVLTANATAGSLQWYRDNGAIKQATTNRYAVRLGGNYKLKVTAAGGCSVVSDSVAATVTVVPTPTITLVNDTLVSSSPTGNQWFEDGVPIPGATGPKYSPVNIDFYSVQVTSGGCTSQISAEYVYMAGTSGIKRKGFSGDAKVLLYPNPAADQAQIELSGFTGGVIVTITDMAGKVVWQQDKLTNSTYMLPLTKLAQGMYLVTVRSETFIQTLKLIKAK